MAVLDNLQNEKIDMSNYFILNDYTVGAEVTNGTLKHFTKSIALHEGYALAGAFLTNKNSLYSNETVYVKEGILYVCVDPKATFSYSATVRLLWLKQF